MSLRPYLDALPHLGERVYVDPAATVIGQVTLADDVSIWPGAVVRGDVNVIHIGARSNIQDGAVCHVTHDGPYSPGGAALTIGADVTVGHRAVLHACTIGARCLIGMGALILDGAVLEEEVMLARAPWCRRASAWTAGGSMSAVRPVPPACCVKRSGGFLPIPPPTMCA